MKIGIFSPYIPKHFGGGERHVLTSAWHFAKNHDVSVIIPTKSKSEVQIREQYENFLERSLQNVQFLPHALADRTTSALETFQFTRQFDIFLYATDGSIFFSGAKRNILHIQIPFHHSLSLLDRGKLLTWHAKNANSAFTREVVEKAWKTEIPFLHYPYVDVTSVPFALPLRKKKQILAVGRFFDPAHTDLHSKRQDILLTAFEQAIKERGWQDLDLHLVGAIEPGTVHEKYTEGLHEKAAGLPVFFHHGISYSALQTLYKESLIFWHAAGYGINPTTHPEKAEHFGMSALEAMAFGTLPIAPNAGGLKETIDHQKNGFLYQDIPELLHFTETLLKLPTAKRSQMQQAARQKAEYFSLERFCQTLDTMSGLS